MGLIYVRFGATQRGLTKVGKCPRSKHDSLLRPYW